MERIRIFRDYGVQCSIRVKPLIRTKNQIKVAREIISRANLGSIQHHEVSRCAGVSLDCVQAFLKKLRRNAILVSCEGPQGRRLKIWNSLLLVPGPEFAHFLQECKKHGFEIHPEFEGLQYPTRDMLEKDPTVGFTLRII